MQDATAGAAAARGRKAKQGKAGNPVDPSKPRIQLSHADREGPMGARLAAPVGKASRIQSFHMLVSTPQNFQLAILEEFRGRCFQAGQGCWEETGPLNPSAPAWGVVYFSSGCQSNRNNSGCLNPLHTTAQMDPDQWKADFASDFSYFFPHIPKSIFSETKNLPNPDPKWKLFSKLGI